MRHFTARPIGGGTFVIALLAALILGCSTLPTAQPAQDLKSIKGKWEGRGTNRKYGTFFMTLTIKEDGEWRMKTDASFFQGIEFSGKAWVGEGKFEFYSDNPQLRGTLTLYSGGGERWLSFMSEDGNSTAELKPSYR